MITSTITNSTNFYFYVKSINDGFWHQTTEPPDIRLISSTCTDGPKQNLKNTRVMPDVTLDWWYVPLVEFM